MSNKRRESEREQFAIWLGMPPEHRHPKTEADLAEKLGVTTVTLSNWKKDPDVKALAQNAIRILGGNEMYAITQALIEESKQGKVKAIELYLKWQGQLAQEKKTELPPVIKVEYATKDRRDDDKDRGSSQANGVYQE